MKVVGNAVDDTQSVTNWPNPIVAGKPKPGIIYNRYHLNLEKGKSETITNECPANYTSKFVRASGTDFFDCKWDNNAISCKNKDKKGRDMDTIEFTCTCKANSNPPGPQDPPRSCGNRKWDNVTMDLSKGKVRKTEGCTQYVTDERSVGNVDGYLSVGKYNNCVKKWECANSFKYATQWREVQHYSSNIKQCNSSEISFMRNDPVIMPKCSDSGAKDGCKKFSNR